jgi:hypothetical protein
MLNSATQALVDAVKVTHQIGAEGTCFQCGQTRDSLKARGEKTTEAR